MSTRSIKSIRGMNDITPEKMAAWHRLEKVVSETFAAHGYGEIRIPVMERTELFSRAIGEETDVVDKEMYTFNDRNDESISLRPEGTAGVVRAVLQNGLLYGAPLRLWYMGPMFRYERPQRGRMRQFHQIGAEVFGAEGPDIDAELLALCRDMWRRLGLENLRLEINSIGEPGERREFQKQLVDFLSGHKDKLDEDSLKRLDRNPFRILDSKNPEIQRLMDDAPSLQQYLGPESRSHFDSLCELLDRLGLDYTINPRLVRGLDYYSHGVFEWITDDLGAQGTVCGGGRYDGLVAIQGGKPWPGVGFAMGMERLVELINQQSESSQQSCDVYLVMAGDKARVEGLALSDRLRREVEGLRVVSNLGAGSFKSQFKRADRSGAELALVLGEDELSSGTIVIKALRDNTGQRVVDQEQLVGVMKEWLSTRTGQG